MEAQTFPAMAARLEPIVDGLRAGLVHDTDTTTNTLRDIARRIETADGAALGRAPTEHVVAAREAAARILWAACRHAPLDECGDLMRLIGEVWPAPGVTVANLDAQSFTAAALALHRAEEKFLDRIHGKRTE